MRKSKTNFALSPPHYDVAIVGGGPAGLTAACVLGTHGFSVLCLDRDSISQTLAPGFDGRTVAISFGSRSVLQGGGVWPALEKLSCPINHIKILDGASPVLLDFLSADVDGRAFGHIVEMRHLRGELHKRIASLENVTLLAPASVDTIDTDENGAHVTTQDGRRFSASLLIGADGRQSVLRRHLDIPSHGWDYGQTAIVCVVEHERPHGNEAVEHFRREGPLAILPMRDDDQGRHRSSLVWTVHGRNAAEFLEMEEEIFTLALAARFPANYGRVRLASKRFSYPLSLQHAHAYKGERIALVAEAAHAMHPIAGQGLNISMRDIAALADLLKTARENDEDFGAPDLLTRYERARRFDTMTMMAATDGLNKLFSNELPVLNYLRKAGMLAVSRLPPAKKFFMHQAMGLSGRRPRL